MLIAWFRRWVFKYRVRQHRREQTSGNVNALLELLCSHGSLSNYNPAYGMGKRLTSHHKTVAALHERLVWAKDVVERKDYVARSHKGRQPLVITLDDYLTTEDGRPVSVPVTLRTLQEAYQTLHAHIAQADEDRQVYYKRQFQHFNEELDMLCVSLISLIDY